MVPTMPFPFLEIVLASFCPLAVALKLADKSPSFMVLAFFKLLVLPWTPGE